MSNLVKIAGTKCPFSEVLNVAEQEFMIMHPGGTYSHRRLETNSKYDKIAFFSKFEMIGLSCIGKYVIVASVCGQQTSG